MSTLVVAGCGSFQIETGQTPDEAAASAETQASELRRVWARNFDSAPGEFAKALLLKQQIDSSAARLVTIGRTFAREWENGNRGRGQAIAAADMRQVIQNSVAKDQPILTAWEDNMDYGWEYVRDSSRFDDRVKQGFGEMIRQYDAVYDAVFFPQADVQTYADDLDRAEAEMHSRSRELDLALDRYK